MRRLMKWMRSFDREARWQSRPHRFFFYFCAVCLSLYFSYVLFLSESAALTTAWDTALSLVWFVLIAAAIFAGLLAMCQRLPTGKPLDAKRRLDPKVFAGAFALCVIVLGCGLLRCYPGGLSLDADRQWTQVQTGQFDNWHPVFHTLLLWLGTRLWNSYPFVIAQQAAVLSLAMAYLMATLHAHGVRKAPLFAVEAIVVTSSLFGNTAMHPWKDNAMTIGALVLLAQSVNVYASRGEWLKRPRNAVAVGLALAFTTMVRHNALLITVSLLAALLLCYPAQLKRLLLTAAVAAGCVALTYGPLYAAVGVTYPDNTFEESIGVPMTVLCDAYDANRDALDDETRAFLGGLYSDEEWAQYYVRGNYNSIKFCDWANRHGVIAALPKEQFWRMVMNTVRADPRGAFESVNRAMDLVWGVKNGEGVVSLGASAQVGEYAFVNSRANQLGAALMKLTDTSASFAPIRWFTANIGVSMALMLLFALRALYRGGCGTLALCVPTLLYNLGTMCLLCGADARFFQFSLPVCAFLPLVLVRGASCQKDGSCGTMTSSGNGEAE